MNRTTYNLVEYQVYQFGDLLVEAAYCDVWTLIVLGPNGEYAAKQHGALAAYQLRDDGLWDSVYHCSSPRVLGGGEWKFVYGDVVEIGQECLKPVADSRFYIQAEFRELQIDQQFREIMAAMDW